MFSFKEKKNPDNYHRVDAQKLFCAVTKFTLLNWFLKKNYKILKKIEIFFMSKMKNKNLNGKSFFFIILTVINFAISEASQWNFFSTNLLTNL